MSAKITIRLPLENEYVVLARMTAAVVASKSNLNVEEMEDIKIAVSEACNNAIQHGGNSDGYFDVNYMIDSEKICIEVLDNGQGFDLSDYQQPNLDKLKGNGLGVFIMQSLMDEVIIESRPDRGTVVKLIKYL